MKAKLLSLLVLVPALAHAQTEAFRLLKDVNKLKADDTVLFVSGDGYSRAMSTTQNNNNRSSVDVVKSDNDKRIVEYPANAAVFTIGTEDGKFTFYNSNGTGNALGYLCSASSSTNWMRTTATLSDHCKATIDIAPQTGAASIKLGSTYSRNNLCFNYNQGTPIYACYPNDALKNTTHIYSWRVQDDYEAPFAAEYKLSYGGEVGNTAQIDLGEYPPVVSYAYSAPGIVEIDENGVMTAQGTGSVTVTASWPMDLDWMAGEATFTVNVVDYALKAPEVEVGESSFSIKDINAEGGKLYYAIADGAWTEYTGAVPFEGEHGKFQVRAMAQSVMPEMYGDSPEAEAYYYVANLDYGDYVLLTDASELRTDDMVIISTNGTYTKAIGSVQDRNNRRAVDVEIWQHRVVVDPSDEVGLFRVTKTGEGAATRYKFYSTNGSTTGYLQATSSSYNLLQTLATAGKGAPAAVTVSGDDSEVTVKYNSYSRSYLGFYTSGTAYSYACYAVPNAEPIYMYVWRQRTEYVHPFADVELVLDAYKQFDLGASHPEISYAVADESIANVDASGHVYGKGAGVTTVTATWPASDYWRAGSVDFTVEVVDPTPEGVEEFAAQSIHQVTEDAEATEFVALKSGVQVSRKVYAMQVPVHTFHAAGADLYVTDNTANARSCVRLEGAPAGIDHTKEIVSLRGRLSKVSVDGFDKYHFLYMSHDGGEADAAPQYREVLFEDLIADSQSAMNLDHHYMLLTAVQYDAEANTISAPSSTYRRVRGTSYDGIHSVADAAGVLGESGAYNIVGYPVYDSEGVKFVALDAEEASDVNTTQIQEINVTTLGTANAIYTLDGVKVNATATPGAYIVRTADGKVIKAIIK